MSNITEIQRLLNEKADLQAQINISAFDGSIEVKTVNDQKYIYVRKREAGKYKSNYIDKYSEELYALAVNQSQQIRAVKKQLRKIEKDLAKLGYTESELSPRVKLNIDFARANVKSLIYDQAVLEGVSTTFPQTETILENGEVNGVKATDVQKILNLKHAWEFIVDPDVVASPCNYYMVNIICLGLDTSVVVIRTLLDKKFSCNRVSELIGTGEPYTYGETYIYPVAHPGYWGTSTRGEDNVIADWRRIRK